MLPPTAPWRRFPRFYKSSFYSLSSSLTFSRRIATRCPEMFHPAPQGTCSVLVQVCQQVLVVHSGRDEFGAGASHFEEQPFAGFINKGHVFEVDEVLDAPRVLTHVVPAAAQFVNPRACEAAAEDPTLPLGRVGI